MATEPTEPAPTQPNDASRALRLEIDPVIESAESIVEHAAQTLPSHRGLGLATRGVAQAAIEAKRVSQRLKRLLGLHRLPALFLMVSLGLLAFWIYWHFFHTPRLTIALSARDAVQLKENLGGRVRIVIDETVGSQESVEKLKRGAADVAFIQGGVGFPRELPRIELGQTELVLFFLRDGVDGFQQIKRSSLPAKTKAVTRSLNNSLRFGESIKRSATCTTGVYSQTILPTK